MASVSREAEIAGLVPGMTQADARAVCPGVDAMPADTAADAALLDRLVSWCGRYTPWVAAEGRDGIFLDVTGCAHLFGGEAAMRADLVRRLEGFGFTARAAVADTPGRPGRWPVSARITLSCRPVGRARRWPGCRWRRCVSIRRRRAD